MTRRHCVMERGRIGKVWGSLSSCGFEGALVFPTIQKDSG